MSILSPPKLLQKWISISHYTSYHAFYRLILFENILFSSISSIEGYIESIIHDLFVLAERRNQWKKSINRIEDHLCGKIGKKFWKMKGTMNQWLYKKKRRRKRRGKNRGFLGGKTADTNRVNKRGSYTYGGKFSASNIVTLLRVITHVAELSADARRLFHGQWEQWGTISRRSLCFTSWCTWRVNPSPHHAAPTKIPPRETVCPNCDRRPPRSTNASS